MRDVEGLPCKAMMLSGRIRLKSTDVWPRLLLDLAS
jgi:hypothetical protein